MKKISWLFLIVLLILPLAAAAEAPSFYCPFDGNYECAPDISPLETKGEFKEGLYGKGISVQDGATVAYPANNIFNIQSGTISLWFKPEGTLTDKPHILFHHQSPSENANLRFRILPSSQNGQCSKCYELAFFVGDGDFVVSKELLNVPASIRGWYHLAATWSNTNLKIYLNGQLISEKNQPMTIGPQDNKFFIGSDRGSIGTNGVIDEFALYTTALSSAQIKALFTQGMSGPLQPAVKQETNIAETSPPKTETIQTHIQPTLESKTEPVAVEQQLPPKQYIEQKQPLQKTIKEPPKSKSSGSISILLIFIILGAIVIVAGIFFIFRNKNMTKKQEELKAMDDFVYKNIGELNSMLNKIKQHKLEGTDVNSLVESLQFAIENSLEHSLNLTVFSSIHMTLHSSNNQGKISPEELKVFDTFYDKVQRAIEKGTYIDFKKYSTLKEEIREMDKSGKFKNVAKLLGKVENELDYNKKSKAILNFRSQVEDAVIEMKNYEEPTYDDLSEIDPEDFTRAIFTEKEFIKFRDSFLDTRNKNKFIKLDRWFVQSFLSDKIKKKDVQLYIYLLLDIYDQKENNLSFVGKKIEALNKVLNFNELNLLERIKRKNKLDLLNGFVKNCKDSSKDIDSDIDKLQEVLGKYGIENNIVELKRLLKEIAFEFEYQKFLKKAVQRKLSTVIECVDVFLEVFGENYRKKLPMLMCLLNDKYLLNKVFMIKPLVIERKKELEIGRYEEKLHSKINKKSINFNSMSGYEFENFLEHLFKLMGYKVENIKASRDQGADLIIERFGEKTAVQAKNWNNVVSNSAVQEIAAARSHYDCEKALVVTTNRFTAPAIELARSNQVELWDRDKLDNIIREYW